MADTPDYTTAEAETRITEAVTRIGEEMGDVGMAMHRTQDETEQLQARAGALDELIASGALEGAILPAGRGRARARDRRPGCGDRAGPDEDAAAGVFPSGGAGGH